MTCSTCKHFRKQGALPKGYCYLNPPTVFFDGGQRRTEVSADGPQSGCGQHEAGEPVVLGKVQPETHGSVIKSAQQNKKGKI